MNYDTWKSTDPFDLNPQETEERMFEPQSEACNCYEEAQLVFAAEPDDAEKIKKLTELGKYVVVSESTGYCKATDALVGVKKHVYGVYDTNERALTVMGRDRLSPYDGDSGFYVAQPQVPGVAEPIVPDFDDTCPF